MLPTARRIRGNKGFLVLNRYGKKIKSEFFNVLYLLNRTNENTKFAVVVTKQTLKQANKRNRVRRRVWAAIAKNQDHFPTKNYLLVFKPKASILNLSWFKLVGLIKEVADKL